MENMHQVNKEKKELTRERMKNSHIIYKQLDMFMKQSIVLNSKEHWCNNDLTVDMVAAKPQDIKIHDKQIKSQYIGTGKHVVMKYQ